MEEGKWNSLMVVLLRGNGEMTFLFLGFFALKTELNLKVNSRIECFKGLANSKALMGRNTADLGIRVNFMGEESYS